MSSPHDRHSEEESFFPYPVAAGPLSGSRFCITGCLVVEREEMSALLAAAGARVTTMVSGLTDYLIVGFEPGLVKLNKAMDYGTKMVDEAEVWSLLGQRPPKPAHTFQLPRFAPRAWKQGQGRLDEAVYAVVDVETTRALGRGQRIIEIAIVQVTSEGEIVDEYATLVNPEAPVVFTHVHGISGIAVREAPTFAEIAGDVAERLAGNVFVAHNVSFDRGVVESEFARLGQAIPDLACLCTMRLARQFHLHPHKHANLRACCEYIGVEMEHHHAALSDTRAAARLLLRYLEEAQLMGKETLADLGLGQVPAARAAWPAFATSGRIHLRRGASLPILGLNDGSAAR
jgi:DNA polymerase III epsilon subunit family exonuclease